MLDKTKTSPKITHEEWRQILETRVVTNELFNGDRESKTYITLNPPIPEASYPIDMEKAQQWVESHTSPNLKQIANKILSHIQHVTFDQFYEALLESIAKLNAKYHEAGVGDDEVLILVPFIDSTKSNPWVTSLALTQLHFKPKFIISHNVRLTTLYLRLNPSIKRILTFDDASYSGIDLCSFLTGIQEDARKIIPSIELDILVPFMTLRSQEKLTSCGNILFSKTMSSLEETLGLDDSEKTLLENYYIHTKLRNLALTYFDHKIADKESVPENIFHYGLKVNQQSDYSTQRTKFAFIPNILPPYKKTKHSCLLYPEQQSNMQTLHRPEMILTEKQAINQLLSEQYPLHAAAKNGDRTSIRALIKEGLLPQSLDFDSNSPLYYATQNTDEATFELLLDSCTDVNFRESRGLTPTHRVAHAGNPQLLQKLLAKNPDLNLTDKDNRTPFEIVCIQLALNDKNSPNLFSCFKMLLPLYKNNQFQTTLHSHSPSFFEKKKTSITEYVLERHNKNHCAISEYTFSMLLLIQDDPKELLLKISDLHYYSIYKAIIDGNIEIIEKSCQYIIQREVKDIFGATPLMYAIVLGKYDIVKLLTENGAELKTKQYDCHLLAKINGDQKIIELIEHPTNNKECVMQ